MRHILELFIRQFRGIENTKFEDLGHVNLFVGGNNSGKTSVLEAIDLHCHPLDKGYFLNISRLRESGPRRSLYTSVRWLFPFKSLSPTGNVEIDEIATVVNSRYGLTETNLGCKESSVLIKENLPVFLNDDLNEQVGFEEYTEEVKALEITMNHTKYSSSDNTKIESTSSEKLIIPDSLQPIPFSKKPPLFPTEFVQTLDHRSLAYTTKLISEMITSGDRMEIVELLKMFDEDIEGIEILDPDGSRSVPYVKHKRMGYTPISVFGEGLRRVLILASAVSSCKDGILLIDELEIAIHSKILGKVFKWLVDACKQNNVQLFATTHSLETIDAVLDAFVEEVEDDTTEMSDKDNVALQKLVAYRLIGKKSKINVKRFSGKSLYKLRYEFGQDVR